MFPRIGRKFALNFDHFKFLGIISRTFHSGHYTRTSVLFQKGQSSIAFSISRRKCGIICFAPGLCAPGIPRFSILGVSLHLCLSKNKAVKDGAPQLLGGRSLSSWDLNASGSTCRRGWELPLIIPGLQWQHQDGSSKSSAFKCTVVHYRKRRAVTLLGSTRGKPCRFGF